MTFSIVAVEGRQVGVAVCTKHLAVGCAVPWIHPTAGGCASQAETSQVLGLAVIDAMAGGASASEAVSSAVAADPEKDHRQVHAVRRASEISSASDDAAADGKVVDAAAHTGCKCVPWAGHVTSPAEGFSVAGNMLAGGQVVHAMADAYRAAQKRGEPLAERLVAALEAGDAAGGDKRGHQSSAVKVFDGQRYPLIDLRVDDHADPVTELRRLLRERRKPYAASFYDSRPRARL